MKTTGTRNKLKYAAAASALGFSLNRVLEQDAHAYYASSGHWVLLTATTTSGVLTTAGVVVLVILLLDDDRATNETQTLDDGKLARGLIESGLLNARGDLGMELSLIVESPTAFEQVAQDMAEGNGAALNSLTRTTNIPQSELISMWQQTSQTVGPVEDEASATKFMMNFLLRMGHDLEVEQNQLADFSWQLIVEQTSPVSPENAHAHKWLADWMGLPLESVLAASQKRLAQQSDGSDLRADIQQDPEAFLSALSQELEAQHPELIRSRVDTLVSEFSQCFPDGTLEAVGSPA